jgi:acetyl-CoA carboxylase biotin carboxyl carrier protein
MSLRGTSVAIIEIKTDITGTVWKVLKQVGDAVEEDEPIVILESMKMEIPVAAVEPGVVKDILVKEGDTASEGSIVARIEV